MKLIQEKIIILCGLWLLVLPYTGFPRSWKSAITAITALVIIYVGALLFRKARLYGKSLTIETKTKTFTETT